MMIRLVRRWWQKVVIWIGRLMGRDRTSKSVKAEVPLVEMKPLSDRAYETLYFSLLQRQEDSAPNEATAQVKAQLGERENDANFVGWLRRFGKTLSKNPADNAALARRMVALSGIELGELSRLSKEVGERLVAEAAVSSVESQTTDNSFVEDEAAEPDSAESSEPEKLAEFYFQQGNYAYLQGDFRGAIAAYDAALNIRLDYHAAFFNRGLSLHGLTRYKDAVASYDEAIRLNSSNHEYFYRKARSLVNLNRREDALVAYDQAISINPNDYRSYSDKAANLNNLYQYENALSTAERALELGSQFSPHPFHVKGFALNRLGLYEDAILACDQALARRQNYRPSLLEKGFALNCLTQYREAITIYDKVLMLSSREAGAWMGRSFAVRYTTTEFSSTLRWENMPLSERGYEGQIACLKAGLSNISHDDDTMGWGQLHHELGKAHYLHGRFLPNSDIYLAQAVSSYQNALSNLQYFPQIHLEVLRDVIRACLGLGDVNTAKDYQEKGLKVFRQLLNDALTLARKQQLDQQFSSFSQLQVDTLIKDTSQTAALEAAEYRKTRVLSWILDSWKEKNVSPSWVEIRSLLTPDTIIIYWHLSPDSLTTFLLTAEATEPQIISVTSAEALKTWIKAWQNVYQTYRKKGKSVDEVADRDRPNHPWRLSLDAELQKLRDILDIEQIEASLSQNTHLLLVPHRQLHQLPLHALFTQPFITTYLPSLQTGLTLKQKQSRQSQTNSLPALLLETPENDELESLVFAEVETALVAHLCQQQGHSPTLINSDKAHNSSVTTTLHQPHNLFHFTGHGAHDYRHPKNSALALTGTDTLTANEIATLPLDTYDLVTLAACETAVAGQADLDTDYVSLASAFLTAGATQVISTLWTVDSESNAWLMVYFYQRYLTGTPAPVALHQAQQWLRTVTYTQLADWLASLNTEPFSQSCQNGEDETLTDTIGKHRVAAYNLQTSQTPYANPYYWAAFTLTGYCHEGQ